MSDHHFESSSRLCVGCDASMEAVEDGKAAPCPSRAQIVSSNSGAAMMVVSAPDRVVLVTAIGNLRFDRHMANSIIDAMAVPS